MIDANITTIVGRLTKDAELKLNTILPIGFFIIASNRSKKMPDGNHIEEASFFNVNVYGRYAEIITPKLRKGKQVCVVGSLKQERWIDHTGQNRSRVVLEADTIQILGGNNV